mmetsp:Transcript_13981/g.26104  ORF Transcript_13981/g.26104 Transcript_13981/m.26104 type:complete len:397 (-) Transcript_13981:12-1202(-)
MCFGHKVMHLTLILLLSLPLAFASTIIRKAEVASDGIIDLLPPKPESGSDNTTLVTLNRVEACERSDAEDCGRRRGSAPDAKRIAVYTYVTGEYEEIRDFNVPCVPTGVDAFFILDNVTRKAASEDRLEFWRRRGWWILTMLPTVEGTNEVSLARFAAKSLKFLPPAWLQNGTWDWLVEFDGDISMDLSKIRSLVDKHTEKSLLLLKWYWKDCQPWDCFMWECEDMLQNRKEYVETSHDSIVKWKEHMQQLHADKEHPFVPSDYYELSVMFRHVAHERAGLVEEAFRQVLQQCRTIQRDQFLVPFFLWNASLEQDVVGLPIATLYSELDYCSVETRQGRNLMSTSPARATNSTARLEESIGDTWLSDPDKLYQRMEMMPPRDEGGRALRGVRSSPV